MIQRILFYFSLGSCLVSYGSECGDITEERVPAVNLTEADIRSWMDKSYTMTEYREMYDRLEINTQLEKELEGIRMMLSKRQRKILYTEKLRKQFGNKTEDNQTSEFNTKNNTVIGAFDQK